jgi:hypothetical protein
MNSKLAESVNKDLPILGEAEAVAYAKILTTAIPTLTKPKGKDSPFTKLVSEYVNRVPVMNEIMQVVIAAKACPQCGVVYATNLDGKVDSRKLESCKMEICGLVE